MTEKSPSHNPDELDDDGFPLEIPRSQRSKQQPKPMFPLFLGMLILVMIGLAAVGYMISHGIIWPGQDFELLKKIQNGIRFHLVKDQAISVNQLEPINTETDLVIFEPSAKSSSGVYFKLDRTPAMLGTNIKEAWLDKDEMGANLIKISFDATGSDQFADFTAKHIGEQLAIVYGDRVISAPVIQSRISGGQAQITGRNIEAILEEIRNAEESSSAAENPPEKN
ncbi:MAG: Protein export membrane protein SecD [uncultured bacterium]|nr:MAG: Protein export membrane protein SecD [uncultured bacterium]